MLKITENVFYTTATLVSLAIVIGTTAKASKCQCEVSEKEFINLKAAVDLNTNTLLEWTKHIHTVKTFIENWKKEVEDQVKASIKLLADDISNDIEIKLHLQGTMISEVQEELKSIQDKVEEAVNMTMETEAKVKNVENRTTENEEQLEQSLTMISKIREKSNELANNVMKVQAEVQKVENKTMKMEEKIDTEQRVISELKDNVEKAQTSLDFVEDQLTEVTVSSNKIRTALSYNIIDTKNVETEVKNLINSINDIVEMFVHLQRKLKTLEQRMPNFLDEQSLDELSKKVENMQKDIKKVEGMVEEDKYFQANLKRDVEIKLHLQGNTISEVEKELKSIQDKVEEAVNMTMETEAKVKNVENRTTENEEQLEILG